MGKSIIQFPEETSPTLDDFTIIVHDPNGTPVTRKVSLANLSVIMGGVPGGSDGQVQFNDGGLFGGDSGLFWDNTGKKLGVGTETPAAKLHVVGDAGLKISNTAEAFNGFLVAVSPGLQIQSGDGTPRITINNSNGFVGIGMAPEANLDLAGTTLRAANLIRDAKTSLIITESGATGGMNVVGEASINYNLTNTANNVKRALAMTVHQRSGGGTINTGGILIDIFTQPDNGGDVSGIWVRQSGGGNALSIYNLSADRPAGYENYPDNGFAIEVGVDGGKHAIYAFAQTGRVFYAKPCGATGGGMVVQPSDDNNLGRRGFQIVNSNNSVEKFYVDLSGNLYAVSKSFMIPHPTKPGWLLIHSSLEGPEMAVFYRGEGQLVNGKATITLPNYFEALTRLEGRTVLLTPKFNRDREQISSLASSAVVNGQFMVRALDVNNPSQEFYWEVKAVRTDISELVVERRPDKISGIKEVGSYEN
jgi:hypothetical protein